MTENTFIIIKPDAIRRGLTDTIIERFQKIGDIKWIIGLYKNRDWCRMHYKHIKENPELSKDYTIMEDFMSGKLLIGFLLRGDSIIEHARVLVGSTRTWEAQAGTIRGEFRPPYALVLPICHNLVHVADSKQSVIREINLFLNRSLDHDFNTH